MKKIDIKECIKGNVTFIHYKDKHLWYSCENGFTFPVPIDDIGDATFMASDKGLLFMRYIRPQIKFIESIENAAN